MYIVLGVIFAFLAFLIISVILLQEGKGGGLAAMGGAMTDSVMGAKNPLRRITAVLFICFIVLILGINYCYNNDSASNIDQGIQGEIAKSKKAQEVADEVAEKVKEADEAASGVTAPIAPETSSEPAAPVAPANN